MKGHEASEDADCACKGPRAFIRRCGRRPAQEVLPRRHPALRGAGRRSPRRPRAAPGSSRPTAGFRPASVRNPRRHRPDPACSGARKGWSRAPWRTSVKARNSCPSLCPPPSSHGCRARRHTCAGSTVIAGDRAHAHNRFCSENGCCLASRRQAFVSTPHAHSFQGVHHDLQSRVHGRPARASSNRSGLARG